MSQQQRRRTQLSFARQIVRADSMQSLNLMRQMYRAELGRQSPEREVLDLLAQAIEGHLRTRELADAAPCPHCGVDARAGHTETCPLRKKGLTA